MCNIIGVVIVTCCFPLIIYIYNRLLYERDINNAIFNHLSSRISNIDYKIFKLSENIQNYKIPMVEISYDFNKSVNDVHNRYYYFKYALDELEKSFKTCSINTSQLHRRLTEITNEISYLNFKASNKETSHIQLSRQVEDIFNKWNLNLEGFDKITKHIEQLFQNLKAISLSVNNSRTETKSLIDNYESYMITMNLINKENECVKNINETLITQENRESEDLLTSYYENHYKNSNNISLAVLIPLEDYAVQSTGCKIIRNMTAATYFPYQYHLDIYLHKLLESIGTRNLIRYIPNWTGESVYRYLHIDELSRSPYKAIQPDVYPGSCWPMKGSKGNLTVELADEIVVRSVTIDHINSQDVTDIGTSPKQFQVYSYDIMRDVECLLTTGILNVSNQHNTVQNFPAIFLSKCALIPSKVIKLVILSNYGNSNYTCVYRFRIHSS